MVGAQTSNCCIRLILPHHFVYDGGAISSSTSMQRQRLDYNQTLHKFHRVRGKYCSRPEEYVKEYIKWMKRQAYIRGNREYRQIAEWVEAHQANQATHIYNLFPQDLQKPRHWL